MTRQQELALSIQGRANFLRDAIARNTEATGSTSLEQLVYLMQVDYMELQSIQHLPLPQSPVMSRVEFEKRNWRGDLE